MAAPSTPTQAPEPAWLKDAQTLTSPELDRIDTDLRAGKLSEAQAQPLLLQAAMRAVGKALADAPAPQI